MIDGLQSISVCFGRINGHVTVDASGIYQGYQLPFCSTFLSEQQVLRNIVAVARHIVDLDSVLQYGITVAYRFDRGYIVGSFKFEHIREFRWFIIEVECGYLVVYFPGAGPQRNRVHVEISRYRCVRNLDVFGVRLACAIQSIAHEILIAAQFPCERYDTEGVYVANEIARWYRGRVVLQYGHTHYTHVFVSGPVNRYDGIEIGSMGNGPLVDIFPNTRIQRSCIQFFKGSVNTAAPPDEISSMIRCHGVIRPRYFHALFVQALDPNH